MHADRLILGDIQQSASSNHIRVLTNLLRWPGAFYGPLDKARPSFGSSGREPLYRKGHNPSNPKLQAGSLHPLGVGFSFLNSYLYSATDLRQRQVPGLPCTVL